MEAMIKKINNIWCKEEDKTLTGEGVHRRDYSVSDLIEALKRKGIITEVDL